MFMLTCCSKRRDVATALPVDLMALDPPSVPVTGFRPVERAAGIDFRWVTGPQATLTLTLDAPRRLKLAFTASNPIAGQTITVLLQGRPVASFEAIPGADRLTGFTRYEADLDLQAGVNTVALAFERYNRRTPEETFAPEDKEGLAIMISGLEITPASL